MDEKLIEFMKISGLNLYESKIYFSLLKHGAVTRSEIYKIAEVPQSRVYDIINSLIAKSLVKQADNQLIVPQHPRSIINSNSYLKNKERIIKTKQNMESQLEIINKKLSVLSDDKSIFCELEKMYDSPSTQHPVVKRFLSLFKNSQKEILCCTTLPILYPSGQFYKEVLSAVERGISYRRLLGYDYIMAQGEKSIIADSKKGIKIKAIAEDNIPEKYYVVDDSSVFLLKLRWTLKMKKHIFLIKKK
jgi:sugar-specific transcriptional regulator TrmB